MALRCAAADETGQTFDGVLAMDPNLERDTCFLTGMFSQLDPRSNSDVVHLLKRVGDRCETISEWVEIHDHVVNCVDKLSSDLSALVRQCQEIAGPFFAVKPGELSPFIHWYRLASERTSRVKCIFADDPRKRSIIANVRMRHLDDGCLGDRFSGDSFAFIAETRHMDLMRTDVFLRHMQDLTDSIPSRNTA